MINENLDNTEIFMKSICYFISLNSFVCIAFI